MFAAVVLAGGAGRRMAGRDKPAIEIGGRSLLARAVEAVAGADPVVVVGPPRPLRAGVVWTREDPPGSGPLAALAAGLARVGVPGPDAAPGTGLVAVLAADLVGVSAATVARLRAALTPAAAGALVVDDEGARQWLLGVWRVAALRDALPADPAGRSMRATLGGLTIVEVPAGPGEADDVDTPADLDRHAGR